MRLMGMLTFLGLYLIGILSAQGAEGNLDFTQARVAVLPGAGPRVKKAAQMLVEEVEKRGRTTWPIINGAVDDAGGRALITLGVKTSNSNEEDKEGFSIATTSVDPPVIQILGNDERGVLFGVGYLLRKLNIETDHVLLPKLEINTKPAIALRGHQLGYRPKTNSYDAWDLPQWEQYIRDLVVFGSNAIELVPPKTDDADTSPHFPRPKIEMMAGMSKLADDYGLDVWIWYPAIDGDYGDPAVVEQAIKEWGEVLSKLPRCDVIFVPTGDPGNTSPKLLMPMLEKQAAQLKKIHPNAQWWISVQGLTKPRWDEIMAFLATEPKWLTGVGYGPQTRVSLPELRMILPKRYPIRRYPDITHCIWCQYPTVDWDLAFATTEGREGVNPRPVDQSIIFRAFDDDAIGFITYSEGCNDDVNKIVWSGLGWKPDGRTEEILQDYARYFIGPKYTESFAQGLYRLEGNWRGPILSNSAIPKTLELFQEMEKSATPELKKNWRFQQALYRAYYDAFVRERLIHETSLEKQALEKLAKASELGPTTAIDEASAILAKAKSEPVAAELRQRVFDLAEDLYQSIRMQLSVPKYKAIELWRGANLDSIDVPLNNAEWLGKRFKEIAKLEKKEDQLQAIDEIVRWEDAGPGGFYDDLGDPLRQPHLVRNPDYKADPASLRSAYVGFQPEPGLRRSWCTYVDGLFETPVVVKYDGLDPAGRYKIRLVYASDRRKVKTRLTTDDGAEIHPWMDRPMPVRPIEFAIPPTSTKDGSLTLEWRGEPDRGGNGRGPQVAEVWLIKE